MSIQILPPRLANQIAAGEVVERPASVVKELVENSLDAGATTIDVDIEKGGNKLIRIRDNGKGIPKDELALALSRHATSKIQTLDDLEAIMSLGFRGEALASVSSVSRLTMTSRTVTQPQAWSAYAQGRDMAVKIMPAAHPVGTSVEVLDLFFNTPARRKFLRTEKTEFTHIDELLKRIALSRLDVSIRLTHNGKLIRQYRAATTQAQIEKRIATVFGHRFIQHSVAFEQQQDDLTIKGWLATPEAARSQNDQQFCYVNGRMMRDKVINHAIRQSYESTLPPEMYAAYVVYIEIDPHLVDVNVHPAKHEVRFHHARLVHDFIYQVLRSALSQALDLIEPTVNQSAYATPSSNVSSETSSPAFQSSKPESQGSVHGVESRNDSRALRDSQRSQSTNSKQYRPYRSAENTKTDSQLAAKGSVTKQAGIYQALFETLPAAYQANTDALKSEQNSDEASSKQLSQPILNKNEQEHQSKQADGKIVSNDEVARLNQTKQAKKPSRNFVNFQSLGKALSVIEKHFLLFEHQQGLGLLNLNRAQYWKLYAHLNVEERKQLIKQPLLIPLQLAVQKEERILWQSIQSTLARFGIEIELSPNHQSMRVMAVPEPLRHQNLQRLLPALLAWFKQQESFEQPNIDSALTQWLASFCAACLERYTLSQGITLIADLEKVVVANSQFEQLLIQDISLVCPVSFEDVIQQMTNSNS